MVCELYTNKKYFKEDFCIAQMTFRTLLGTLILTWEVYLVTKSFQPPPGISHLSASNSNPSAAQIHSYIATPKGKNKKQEDRHQSVIVGELKLI